MTVVSHFFTEYYFNISSSTCKPHLLSSTENKHWLLIKAPSIIPTSHAVFKLLVTHYMSIAGCMHMGWSTGKCCDMPKFHLARLDSIRLDSTRSTLSIQSSESRRACRARRAVLFQLGGRQTSYSVRLYKFSRFYALAYTNPICFVK